MVATVAAESLLRVLGGCEVKVDWTSSASSNGSSGLAVSAPAQQQVTLGPAMVRRIVNTEKREIVVSAASTKAAFGVQDATQVRAVLMSAVLTVGSERLRVTSVLPEWVAGEEYLYRIGIEE